MKRLEVVWLTVLLCSLQGFQAGAREANPWIAQENAADRDVTLSELTITSSSGQSAAPAGGYLAYDSDPAALFRQGKEAMQSGKLGDAEEDFRKVIALDPKSGAAHVNLGVAYMRQRRWNAALDELHRAQSLSPDEAGIWLNIGLVDYRKGDFSSAVGPFSAALQISPDSLQARYLLGLCYFFINKYQQASDTLAPLWDKEATNMNYLYVLTIAASKCSKAALQTRAFAQMLATGRDTPEFHLYSGKALLAENDSGKALEEFRAAATARPDLPLVHYFLGRTYLERHAYPEAIAELQRDIAIEPDFAYNYEDLGILSAQVNEPDKAERYYREAIERDSTLVNSWFGLAKLYREAARSEESLDMLDHAVALVPESASLHFTRGQVLARLGRSAEARQEYVTTAKLHKSLNDRLQQDHSADTSADAEAAAQE